MTAGPRPGPPSSLGVVYGSRADVPDGWLPPRRAWSASDHALATLIDSLRMGMFAVGQRLPSLRELSAAIGVSHVVMREALDVLENEGIVEVRRGRGGGISVTGITGLPRCLSRIYDDHRFESLPALIAARAVLEREIAILAIDASDPEGLLALDSLLDAMGGATDRPELFVELSVRFELRLARMAGNPVLIQYMRDVLNRLAVLGFRTSAGRLTTADLGLGHRTYRDLVDGLRTGDREDVRSAIDRHVAHLNEVVSRTAEQRAAPAHPPRRLPAAAEGP